MNKSLFFFFLVWLVGCSKADKNPKNIFFAGEIVNPTSTHIVLFNGDKVIDSALLDDQNRFSFTLDSLQQGLYHFSHAPEFQYVYLEQGDSLMIRLNTADFDESLVFSGKGEEINNFLLELFLANEEEAPLIDSYFVMEAKQFAHKVDSLKQAKHDLLAELYTDGSVTDKERSIAKASIDYNYNTFKEIYPFKHKKLTHNGMMEALPEDFYDYRNSIDFGNHDFTYLRPYYSFMLNHIQNLSYMDCSIDCANEGKGIKNQLHFNEHKMHLIDSLITEKELKDNLFRYVAFDYLLHVHDSGENISAFINTFHELSKNNRHIDEIDNLFNGIENIQPSKSIPDIYVSKVNGDSISLREISKNGKTVFYFWSGSEKKHFDNISERVAALSAAKPDYRFIGINIRTSEGLWKNMLEISNLDQESQFRAVNFESLTNALIINKLNKCVITDKGQIVDAFSDINSAF
jgi:hypothetical protein